MRTRWIALLAALMMVLLLPASASAAPKATNYQGTFGPDGVYGGCRSSMLWDGPIFRFDVRGTWDVTIDGASADVAATIEMNMLPRNAPDYEDGWFLVDSFNNSENPHGTWTVLSHGPFFHLRIPEDQNVFGSQEDFVLTGHQLQWRIQPYPFPPLFDCQFAESYGQTR